MDTPTRTLNMAQTSDHQETDQMMDQTPDQHEHPKAEQKFRQRLPKGTSQDPSKQTDQAPDQDPDPFTDPQNLEFQFYAEGLQLGITDGTRAGKTEGRTFGLETSLSKFSTLGRLGGRAAVWEARLDSSNQVAGVKGSERLRRNVARVRELADPETLDMRNGEEEVEEFEGRVREAQAKAVLVRKGFGESEVGAGVGSSGARGAGGEMEDFEGLPKFKK